MRNLKKAFDTLAIVLGMATLGLPIPVASVHADPVPSETVTFFYNYDVTTAGYTYGTFAAHTSKNIDPLSQTGMVLKAKVVTSGSSTTTSALTASTGPFNEPGVGDLVVCNLPATAINIPRTAAGGERSGQRVERLIVTNADNDTITTDTAWDLGTTGQLCYWKNFVSGTAATDGWFPVQGTRGINVKATVTTLNATSLDFELSCRDEGTPNTWNQVYTKNFTSATYPANSTAFSLPTEFAGYDFCRVGWRINTDGGAQSVQTKVTFTR